MSRWQRHGRACLVQESSWQQCGSTAEGELLGHPAVGRSLCPRAGSRHFHRVELGPALVSVPQEGLVLEEGSELKALGAQEMEEAVQGLGSEASGGREMEGGAKFRSCGLNQVPLP